MRRSDDLEGRVSPSAWDRRSEREGNISSQSRQALETRRSDGAARKGDSNMNKTIAIRAAAIAIAALTLGAGLSGCHSHCRWGDDAKAFRSDLDEHLGRALDA